MTFDTEHNFLFKKYTMVGNPVKNTADTYIIHVNANMDGLSDGILKVYKNRDLTYIYETLQHLTYPNWPQVYEVKYDGSDTFVVEENLKGSTLEALLTLKQKKNTLFTLEETLKLGTELCEALKLLHDLRPPIIHHDIKPSNIVIDQGKAKLIDFDIARFIHNSPEKDTTFLGTREYAPPEQVGIANLGQSDARSDIYSLGIVMCEMLTGNFPTGEVLPDNKILNENMQKILCKCIKFQPEQRYQNIEELHRDLQTVYSSEISEIRKDTETHKIQKKSAKPAARKKISGKPAFVILLLILLGGAGFLFVSGNLNLPGFLQKQKQQHSTNNEKQSASDKSEDNTGNITNSKNNPQDTDAALSKGDAPEQTPGNIKITNLIQASPWRGAIHKIVYNTAEKILFYIDGDNSVKSYSLQTGENKEIMTLNDKDTTITGIYIDYNTSTLYGLINAALYDLSAKKKIASIGSGSNSDFYFTKDNEAICVHGTSDVDIYSLKDGSRKGTGKMISGYFSAGSCQPFYCDGSYYCLQRYSTSKTDVDDRVVKTTQLYSKNGNNDGENIFSNISDIIQYYVSDSAVYYMTKDLSIYQYDFSKSHTTDSVLNDTSPDRLLINGAQIAMDSEFYINSPEDFIYTEDGAVIYDSSDNMLKYVEQNYND